MMEDCTISGMEEKHAAMSECLTVFSNYADSEFIAMDCIDALINEHNNLDIEDEEKLRVKAQELAQQVDVADQGSVQLEEGERRLAEATQQLLSLNNELEVCETERGELEQKRDTVHDTTTKLLPTLEQDARLYRHISGISRQQDSLPNEVKGYVLQDGRVKTFSLDRQKNSQFFIANYVWDLMEPNW